MMLVIEAVTVAVFAATVSDPNAGTPLSAVLYPASTCGLPTYVEVTPIVNPTQAYYPDPSDASKDCRLDIRAQIAPLGKGLTYRAAAKVDNGMYGELSTVFAVQAPPTFAVSATTVAPKQPVTITVTNAPGQPADWLALAMVGSPAGQSVQWVYVGLPGVTTRTWTVTIDTPGRYEVRLHPTDLDVIVATSPAFTVEAAPVPPVPPAPSAFAVAAAVTQCRYTLTDTPPDATGGWGVQFQRGMTTVVNIGRRDVSAPFQQSTTLAAALYTFRAVWTKAGATTVVRTPIVQGCGS